MGHIFNLSVLFVVSILEYWSVHENAKCGYVCGCVCCFFKPWLADLVWVDDQPMTCQLSGFLKNTYIWHLSLAGLVSWRQSTGQQFNRSTGHLQLFTSKSCVNVTTVEQTLDFLFYMSVDTRRLLLSCWWDSCHISVADVALIWRLSQWYVGWYIDTKVVILVWQLSCWYKSCHIGAMGVLLVW